MKIWVDADACPVPIKEIIFRTAVRKEILTTLIANHTMRVPPSPYIKFTQVGHGFDIADNEIIKRLDQGDLVITQDIPLAAEAIEKGAVALNPRGELYTTENIKQRLNMRDFMETLRSSGVNTSGPAPLNHKDRQHFANSLDRLLHQK